MYHVTLIFIEVNKLLIGYDLFVNSSICTNIIFFTYLPMLKHKIQVHRNGSEVCNKPEEKSKQT